MQSTKLKISVAQMNSIDDVQHNLMQMKQAISEAAQNQSQIIFFPENCVYMRVVEGEKIAGFDLNSPIFEELAQLALKHNIFLHLGSVALKVDGHLHNATVVISPDAQVEHAYSKIHLFDITLEGQKPIRESDIFTHGSEPQVLDIHGFKLGQSICYDIRFSELYLKYAHAEVHGIAIPAAFLKTTGEAHWDVLLRARAIETQAYVIASAQCGKHTSAKTSAFRETFGSTQVIDPWGRVLVKADEGVRTIHCEIDTATVDKVRRQIPMKNHRRI